MKTGLLLLTLSLTLPALFAADAPAKEEGAKTEIGNILDGFLNRAKANTSTTNNVNLANLSTDEISSGLKEALGKGLEKAIAALGRTNGFMTNLDVRIPLPPQVKTIQQGLAKIHEEQLADDFLAAMNHAAEKAVPAASAVFVDSLKQMSVQDAVALLQSKSPTAATDYFRRTTSTQLTQKFRPLVEEATAQAGVTSAYKKVMDKASFGSAFFAKSSLNLDQYVTTKALDGLFKMVADEEKQIRENPQARATELLQKVFGAIKR
jgi:hypothetical protein